MTKNELLDHSPLTKGKYKGMTPDKVAEVDGSYVIWMYENWNPKPCSRTLYEACQQDRDNDPNLEDMDMHWRDDGY